MQDNIRINLDEETKSNLQTIVELSRAANQDIIVSTAINFLFYSLNKTTPNITNDSIVTEVKIPLYEEWYIDFVCAIYDEDNIIRNEINNRIQ